MTASSRAAHHTNPSPLEEAANLANEYRRLKKNLGDKAIWPALLSKLKPTLPSKAWTTKELQAASLVAPAKLENQAEQYVRWLFPKNQTGFNLFIPANIKSEFLGQGVVAWHSQRQSWIKLDSGAVVIDPSNSKVIAAPFGEDVGGMGMQMCPVTGEVKMGSQGLSRRIANVRIAATDWLNALILFEIDAVKEVDEVLGHGGASKLMATLPLALRSLVFTGGVSLHGCGIKSRWIGDNIGRVKAILSLIGFDPLTHASTQITRPPGFRRAAKDKDKKIAYQTLVGLYDCKGALDQSSRYQSWQEFVEVLVAWITELKLADEVERLKCLKNTSQPSIGAAQPTKKPKRSKAKEHDYKEIEAHRRCYEIARDYIQNGEWRQGCAIPVDLLNKISDETDLSQAEIVEKFHHCDPHGPAAGSLYALGLVTEAREYIGPLKGKHGILSRKYPKRTPEPILLSEWGHSISVFALLKFSEAEEIAILHEFVILRQSGKTDVQALTEALCKVCHLGSNSIGDWYYEAERGDPKYSRAFELMTYHGYDPNLPELANALGQLLERVEFCLEKAKGKIHEWIDIDCPARRVEFGEGGQLISERKQRKIESLLLPGKNYTLQAAVELAVDHAQFQREYRFSPKWKKHTKELAYSDPTVRQQVRRALDALVKKGKVARTGKGGRGSFTWALATLTKPVQAGNQEEITWKESLHTKVALREQREEGIPVVRPDVNKQNQPLDIGRPKVLPEDDCNEEVKGKRRRSLGLMGYLYHDRQDPSHVVPVVAFGVRRKVANKKQYRMQQLLLHNKTFKVAVVEAIPTFLKTKSLDKNIKPTLTGHLVRGLLWLPNVDPMDIGLQANEVLQKNWIPIKFFVSKKGGSPNLKSSTAVVLLDVTCNYNRSTRLMDTQWETIVDGALAIKPRQLLDATGIKLVREIRAMEATERLKWSRFSPISRETPIKV